MQLLHSSSTEVPRRYASRDDSRLLLKFSPFAHITYLQQINYWRNFGHDSRCTSRKAKFSSGSKAIT